MSIYTYFINAYEMTSLLFFTEVENVKERRNMGMCACLFSPQSTHFGDG